VSDVETFSISEQIARFALNFHLENVPEDVIRHGKTLLLDTFGVAMSCRKMEHAIAIERAVKSFGSASQCSLWGSRDKVQLADAVLYNAALIHGVDYDDTHVAGVVHPSAPVVSMAVGVGEYLHASGKDVLEAIVAGWEIMVCLALAANGGFHDVGYHCTGIVAPFAAACVTAKLMKLPEGVLINALGICGSQAAALQEFLHDGTWVKKFHPGWGAHSAVYALMIAKEGFTGPQRVFEGDFGLWKTHIGRTEGLESTLSNLGAHFRTPEITFKMYPVCHMTHSFIDCMLALRNEKGIQASEIDSIECRIEPRCFRIVCEPREAKVRPRTDYMMRFSLPYVVAVAAVHGKVSPWEIDIKYANDPEIQQLMDKVRCVSDDGKRNPGYFPGWLKVVTKDGRTWTEDRRQEPGSPQNPIALKDVLKKFEHNLGQLYTPENKKRLANLIGKFENLDDVSEFVESLVVQ
jgi:2-methylcitrate dehydratase PrpD